MASLERYQNANGLKHSFKIKHKALAAKIDGVHTDVVITEYSDRFFIILTQYKKLGSLISAYKETCRGNNSEEVYQIRTIQGRDEPDWELVCRYLFEHTGLNKPVLFSVSLKHSDLRVLKALQKLFIENKFW